MGVVMSQQYSLRWNNHQPNFISMFTTLLNTKTLVDVTLAAEGKQLQAHKIVLSACSTYFQALFVDNPSQHPIVILKDVTFDDLRTMVDFMYCGEVNVTEEQLPKVLDTAKHLKIKGLTEMPETSLTRAQGGEPTAEEPRLPPSPAAPPSAKRRRRTKSSTASTSPSPIPEERGGEPMHEAHRESVTLSSLPQRRRDFEDGVPQNVEHLNVEPLPMDAGAAGLPQGAQWSLMDTYPRYSNACLGLSHDPGMYMGGVAAHGLEAELGDYGPAGGAPGPSPGPSCAPEAPAPAPPPLPPKRRRATNPQSGENFQRALEAVRVGGIGFCKAAKMFGVNNRTLWLEYKKKGYPNNRPSIRSRIKREHTTPPPEHKDELPPPDQHMLLCPPHAVPGGFIDTRQDFPLQGVPHNAALNILNFNNLQHQ